MSLALREAWKYQILTLPNPAVGATVVSPCGKILAVEAHHKAGAPHAEVNALKSAYYQLTEDENILTIQDSAKIHAYLLQHHNGCFVGCDIYTTLEPCAHVDRTPSCANLIASLGVSKVYIGSRDTNEIASGGANMLQNAGIEVECGVLEKECDALLLPFLKTQKKGSFVFFKWAQRLDGSTTEGIISCSASRNHVHALRDVCDLLVIGGNTVRTDRPTLDARHVAGKAPDVLIYSKRQEFDRSIPLFHIPSRNVYISDSLDIINNYRCVMVEGGANMLGALEDSIDMCLVYIAPELSGKKDGASIEKKLKLLHQNRIDQDIFAWFESS